MKGKILFSTLSLMFCLLFVPDLKVSAGKVKEQVVYEEKLTDEEFRQLLEEAISDTYASVLTTKTLVNWTVKANSRKTTLFAYQPKNTSVSIGFKLSRTGWAGIIGGDGVVHYIPGTSIYYSFNIDKAQNYLVFVQNNSNAALTATGC